MFVTQQVPMAVGERNTPSGPVTYWTPCTVEIMYSAMDPLALVLRFPTPAGADHHNDWTMARKLFEDGLAHWTGLGDVTLWPEHDPDGNWLRFILNSPSGRAELRVSAAAMRAILDRTYEVMPVHGESLAMSWQVDAVIDSTRPAL